MQPPAIPVAFAPPGQIQWRRFWRIALPLGVISGVGIGLFGIFGVILFLVSLVIGIRRYAREHEGHLTASQGARLGAGTAMVSYLVVLIFFVVQVVIDFSEFRQQWLQSLQQKTGGNPDPQIQRFAEWAAGNQGILVLSLVSALISAVLIAIFCGLIGAIVASSSREKPR
jgi:phosphatidylglycerophosphate synthase